MKISRGHVYVADLSPPYGTEPGKTRPVVVLQTDYLNSRQHSSSIVCLFTSQVKPESTLLRVHTKSGEAGLSKDSDIMIDQLRAIDNRRIKKELGRLSKTRLAEVEEKIKNVLELI